MGSEGGECGWSVGGECEWGVWVIMRAIMKMRIYTEMYRA